VDRITTTTMSAMAFSASPSRFGLRTSCWLRMELVTASSVWNISAAAFSYLWASYHDVGAYYPIGGSMAISRALEHIICAHGGAIRYQQTVCQIAVAAGQARAVETEQGLHVAADVVISNASAPATMLEMVGRAHLPTAYVGKVEGPAHSVATLVVYLGLSMDEDYRRMLAGDFSQQGMIITHYTQVDRAAAPTGGSVLSLAVLAPWAYADQWGTGGQLTGYAQLPQYQALKAQAAARLLGWAEALIPGLQQAIRCG